MKYRILKCNPQNIPHGTFPTGEILNRKNSLKLFKEIFAAGFHYGIDRTLGEDDGLDIKRPDWDEFKKIL